MNRILKYSLWSIVTLLVLLRLSLAAAAENKELVLGVAPYLSANQIMEQFAPLRDYIADILHQKVVLLSAPDVMSFVDRTGKGEYDLILTGPHMGRFAQIHHDWRMVAQSKQKIATVLLVRRESDSHDLEDLRGKKMAIGEQHSITYLLAAEALAQKKIIPGTDLQLIKTASFSDVVQSVLMGETDVGATPTMLWDKWEYNNGEPHRQLREIHRTQASTPFILVMANSRVDQATLDRLTAGLLSLDKTDMGRDFFRKSRLEAFLPLDQTTMTALDPYLHVLYIPEKKP